MKIWPKFRDYCCLIDWCQLSTSALVLVIGLWATSFIPPRIDQERNESRQQGTTNEGNEPAIAENAESRIATYTGWLVAFTGVLAISTILLWYETKRAAVRSAEATRTIERAYVKASPRTPGIKAVQRKEGTVSVALEIRNSGRTPANVTDVVIKKLVLKDGIPFPTTPDYSNPDAGGDTTAFLVANDFVNREVWLEIGVNSLEYEIKTGTHLLLIYGYVDYIDVFNVRHRGGFARRYDKTRDLGDPNVANLIFPTQPGYNYDRLRLTGEGNDWDKTHEQNDNLS